MEELWTDALNLNAGESSGEVMSYGHERGCVNDGSSDDEEEEDEGRPPKRRRGKQPLAHLRQSMRYHHNTADNGSNNGMHNDQQHLSDPAAVAPAAAAAAVTAARTATGSSDEDEDPGDEGGSEDGGGDDDEELDDDAKSTLSSSVSQNPNEIIEILSEEEEVEEDEGDDEDEEEEDGEEDDIDMHPRHSSTPASLNLSDVALTANSGNNSNNNSLVVSSARGTPAPGAVRRCWETGLGGQDSWSAVPAASAAAASAGGPSSVDRKTRCSRNNSADDDGDHQCHNQHRGEAGVAAAAEGNRIRSRATLRLSAPSPAGGGKDGGKMSPEEKRAMTEAEQLAASSGAASGMKSKDQVVGGGGMSKEFPQNLECAMCLGPIAIVAVFACGHEACWKCAHEWCRQGTTPTMDCPTCRAPVPRNDFRRCVILDELIEREVVLSSLDGPEWRARLKDGQDLARTAEGTRSRQREVQRSAEDTIAKQAAELERLRAETTSRVSSRRSRNRAYDQRGPTAMGDYSMRVMGLGSNHEAWMDPESQRDAMEELARSIRSRRTDADPSAAPSRAGDFRVEVAASNAAAAAAVLGMPQTAHYGAAARSRGSTGQPAAATGLGLGGGPGSPGSSEPWFSLRAHQSGRNVGLEAAGIPGIPVAGGAGVGVPGHGLLGRRPTTDSFEMNRNLLRTNLAAAAAAADRDGGSTTPRGVFRMTGGGNYDRSGNRKMDSRDANNNVGVAAPSPAPDSLPSAYGLSPFSVGGLRVTHAQPPPPPLGPGGRLSGMAAAPRTARTKMSVNGSAHQPFSIGRGQRSRASETASIAALVGGDGVGGLAGQRSSPPQAQVYPSADGPGTIEGSTLFQVGRCDRYDASGNLLRRSGSVSVGAGAVAGAAVGQGGGASIGRRDGSAVATASAGGGEDGDSDLDPLDVMSHGELGDASVWDDVLAAVSLPQQQAGRGVGALHRATESPSATHG